MWDFTWTSAALKKSGDRGVSGKRRGMTAGDLASVKSREFAVKCRRRAIARASRIANR